MNIQVNQWVRRHAELILRNGPVLDLACGGGRHGRFFLERGHPVIFVDRDVSALIDMADRQDTTIIEADLENDNPWPTALTNTSFAGVVVVNYLYRPLFPLLIKSLTDDGLLIYQTFARGNEEYGRPRNPDFLLMENELLDIFGAELEVIEFEQGLFHEPGPAVIQRICARKRN